MMTVGALLEECSLTGSEQLRARRRGSRRSTMHLHKQPTIKAKLDTIYRKSSRGRQYRRPRPRPPARPRRHKADLSASVCQSRRGIADHTCVFPRKHVVRRRAGACSQASAESSSPCRFFRGPACLRHAARSSRQRHVCLVVRLSLSCCCFFFFLAHLLLMLLGVRFARGTCVTRRAGHGAFSTCATGF